MLCRPCGAESKGRGCVCSGADPAACTGIRLRYRDIAVAASDLNTLCRTFEKQCELYGVPIFSTIRKVFCLNAFVEYVRSLLAMAEQNFSYESAFRFLRTGMSGFSGDEVDRMENYVIALGIKGYKMAERLGETDAAEWTKKRLHV